MLADNTANAAAIAEALGVVQVQDTSAIDGWVAETLAAHAAEVERYKGGETKLLGFLTGQVMKRSRGRRTQSRGSGTPEGAFRLIP